MKEMHHNWFCSKVGTYSKILGFFVQPLWRAAPHLVAVQSEDKQSYRDPTTEHTDSYINTKRACILQHWRDRARNIEALWVFNTRLFFSRYPVKILINIHCCVYLHFQKFIQIQKCAICWEKPLFFLILWKIIHISHIDSGLLFDQLQRSL